MNKTAVVYTRISKAGGTGLGLESQLDYCHKAAASEGYEIVATHTDDGLSGALPAEKRAGLKAALEDCKKHGAVLLVAKCDRLSRNVAEAARIMELVELRVATMITANNMQLQIMFVFAEQERKFISDRTKEALQKLKDRADNGDVEAQQKIERRNKKGKNTDGKGAEVARAVQSANAQFKAESLEVYIKAAKADGCTTLQKIADYLNARGQTTARGSQFQATTVMRVMKLLNIQ